MEHGIRDPPNQELQREAWRNIFQYSCKFKKTKKNKTILYKFLQLPQNSEKEMFSRHMFPALKFLFTVTVLHRNLNEELQTCQTKLDGNDWRSSIYPYT